MDVTPPVVRDTRQGECRSAKLVRHLDFGQRHQCYLRGDGQEPSRAHVHHPRVRAQNDGAGRIRQLEEYGSTQLVTEILNDGPGKRGRRCDPCDTSVRR